MPDALVAANVEVWRGKRQVVSRVSLRADYGSVTAIIGPNGAGKSSLLRALTGLLPYRGSVQVAGREVSMLAPPERARLLAYVPQQTLLSSNMRAHEVVAQGRFGHARGWFRLGSESEACITRALGDAQVSHLRDRAFNKLSGGEQRRVLLARALATEARVLILDEPTAGLDIGQVLRFHQLVRSLAERGLCVVSVLHDLMDVYHHADRAILLSAGALVVEGGAREVITSPALERIYGVRVSGNVAPFELLSEAP